ncbi:glycosyltransferase [Aquipuribacter sp. SD81]|uniref:glycosyltransferase n=1 Tax=Aquipuribacter sp. SD81 TaxID=3127703 RepID=UPI0030187A68
MRERATSGALQALGPGRSWDGLVVVVAGVTWEGNRLGAQHIAERLTRWAPVLYVDPPRTPMSVRRKPWIAESGREPRLRLVADRLARLTVMVPPLKSRPGGREVAERVLRHRVRGAVRALGGSVRATVVIPPHYPAFHVGEALRVHLASDDFAAGAGIQGVSEAWVRRQERRVARDADLVVAVSPVLQDKWRRLGTDPVLWTNGCDVDLMARARTVRPAADVALPQPVAGFMGTLSERTDVAWLEAVARTGRSLLLVGPRSHTAPQQALDRVLAMPNVQWVGRRPHTEVPSYLAHMDVGLVPYADDAFNRASFPLKVLDYLAAGLPVVARDLPSVRWLGTDHTVLASDAGSFVAEAVRAMDAPVDHDAVAGRRAVAARHGWDARVAELAALLGLPGA